MDDEIPSDARLYRGWEVEIVTESSQGGVFLYARLRRLGWPTLLVGRTVRAEALTGDLVQMVFIEAEQRIDEIEGQRSG